MGMATRQRPVAARLPVSRGGFDLGRAVWWAAAAVGVARAVAGAWQSGASRSGRAVQVRAGDGRTRTVHRAHDIPARGWKDIGVRIYGSIQEDRVLLVAAGVTFYALLALFPATAALVSLYGLFTDVSTIGEHIRLVSGILPDGAVGFISEQVMRLAQQRQAALGLTFFGSLALAAWGANAGTKSIFEALNIIYKEREKRSFIRLTLISMAFTLGGIVIVLFGIAAIVVVPIILRVFNLSGETLATVLSVLRWPLLYAVILFALACLYRYGPSRVHARWRWITWGSAIAGAIWIAASLLLSWYIANFGNYNVTYGSLGAVVGFLMWTWMSTIIVMLGGEVNAEMEGQDLSYRSRDACPPAKHALPSEDRQALA